ncbi:diguanylate cyclase [Persephonella sp.]|nr:sensor domain-containing diguanylate cyclase [Aquificota bacterium]
MDELLSSVSEKLTQFLHENLEDFKYFSDKVEKIKGYYLDILREILREEFDRNEVKKKSFVLGRYFFENDISYMLLLDIDDHIVPYVIELISSVEEDIPHFVSRIHLFEERVRYVENKVAYGYLTENIKQDKNWIREKLRIIKNSESTMKPFVRDHLIWVNRILEDIRKLRPSASVPLGHYNCELGRRLEHSDGLGIFDEYRDEIIILHKKIHGSAVQIYHFLHTRDYKHLLLEYLEFFNLVGKFVSLLGLTFAVMYEEDANIDPLTKVLSRRSLEFILSSQFHIAKISKRPLSVAMVDIDNFKQINDRYGHQIGDCVLRRIAQRIQDALRKSDFIFRYGGEEFLVLLPFTSKSDAVKVLDKIVSRVSGEPVKCGEFNQRVTVSAGVSSIEDARDIYSLISRADRALYKAKKAGKNRVST